MKENSKIANRKTPLKPAITVTLGHIRGVDGRYNGKEPKRHVWLLLCTYRALFRAKTDEHISHLNAFSPYFPLYMYNIFKINFWLNIGSCDREKLFWNFKMLSPFHFSAIRFKQIQIKISMKIKCQNESWICPYIYW